MLGLSVYSVQFDRRVLPLPGGPRAKDEVRAESGEVYEDAGGGGYQHDQSASGVGRLLIKYRCMMLQTIDMGLKRG